MISEKDEAVADVLRAAFALDEFHQRAPGMPREGVVLRDALHEALDRLRAAAVDIAVRDAANREACCEDHERGIAESAEPCGGG